MTMPARSAATLIAAALLAAALGACGKSASPALTTAPGPAATPRSAGAVSVVTKNTARLGGADPASDAAAVARAVYPGLTPASRPQAVVVVNEGDWPAAMAAAALAGPPLRAPLLYSSSGALPAVSATALEALRPLGAAALAGAQVLSVGVRASVPGSYRVRAIAPGGDVASVAGAVARLLAALTGRRPHRAIMLVQDTPQAEQMPAAALAAESGAPVLVMNRSSIPAATRLALEELGHPALYLLAGSVRPRTLAALARLGKVSAIVPGRAGSASRTSPVETAVAAARYADGSFGWGVREAGHGLVFANASRPLDAPAAAALSSHGDYGPLLLLDGPARVPAALARYLSDIEPGYTSAIGPVRAVYNHGWLIGDEGAISALAQAEIDSILEVAPRASAAEQPVAPE